MTLLTNVYTSQAEIERIMSKKSSELYTDDYGIGIADEPEIWDDAINQATDTINIYVQGYYLETILVNNSWVRRIASWIAAHFITRRRGNPGAYETEYYEFLAMLERIKKGELQIPRAPLRNSNVPMMSNYVVDDRYPVNKLRVQQQSVVGGTSEEQDLGNGPWPDIL